MNQRHRIAIAIAFGPEVRAFVYSGLARRLAESYDVFLLAYRPKSAAFTDLVDIELLPLLRQSEPTWLARLRSWSNHAQADDLRRQGSGVWAHWLGNGASRRKARVCRALGRIPGLNPTIRRVERTAAHRYGTHAGYREVYESLGIDCLIAGSAFSPRLLPALQTAANTGRKTIVACNSWKDVYSTPNVSVAPDRLVVWSRPAAMDVQRMNPHLPGERIAIAESLHLDPFVRRNGLLDRAELCARLGLDPGRPFLCYTAASPRAVLHEQRIVACLLEGIRSRRLPHRPQLLVRLNPMDDVARFAEFADDQTGDIVFHKPEWEWDAEADWCCALPEDVPVWVATVAHAALNVSIASTVTLEFNALNRPVVNVAFDLPEPLPPQQSNRRFWDADFYREIRERGAAIPAFSPDELLRTVANILTKPPVNGFGLARSQEPSPVERVAGIVAEVLPP